MFAALLQIHWRESSQSLPALGEKVSYESENRFGESERVLFIDHEFFVEDGRECKITRV